MDIAIKIVVGYLAFVLLSWAGVPPEVFFALGLVFVIGWPIGWIMGSMIHQRYDVDTGQFKVIGWANLVAWIIPFLGVAVAKLTSDVGKESTKNELFYDGMSIVGYGLVLISVALTVPLMLSETCGP